MPCMAASITSLVACTAASVAGTSIPALAATKGRYETGGTFLRHQHHRQQQQQEQQRDACGGQGMTAAGLCRLHFCGHAGSSPALLSLRLPSRQLKARCGGCCRPSSSRKVLRCFAASTWHPYTSLSVSCVAASAMPWGASPSFADFPLHSGTMASRGGHGGLHEDGDVAVPVSVSYAAEEPTGQVRRQPQPQHQLQQHRQPHQQQQQQQQQRWQQQKRVQKQHQQQQLQHPRVHGRVMSAAASGNGEGMQSMVHSAGSADWSTICAKPSGQTTLETARYQRCLKTAGVAARREQHFSNNLWSKSHNRLRLFTAAAAREDRMHSKESEEKEEEGEEVEGRSESGLVGMHTEEVPLVKSDGAAEGGGGGEKGAQEDEEAFTVDEALTRTGFGVFQFLLLGYTGLAWAAEAMELLLLSFVGPAAAAEWQLAGEQESVLASAVFGGMLFGAYGWGVLADSRGRRFSFGLSALLTSAAGIGSALAPSFPSLLLLRTLVGVGLGGAPVVFSWFTEFVPAKERGFWAVAVSLFWTAGSVAEAGLAWGVLQPSGWRWLIGLSSAPFLLLLLLLPLVPESPRFLLTNGRSKEALAVLCRIATANGTPLSSGRLIVSSSSSSNNNSSRSSNNDNDNSNSSSRSSSSSTGSSKAMVEGKCVTVGAAPTATTAGSAASAAAAAAIVVGEEEGEEQEGSGSLVGRETRELTPNGGKWESESQSSPLVEGEGKRVRGKADKDSGPGWSWWWPEMSRNRKLSERETEREREREGEQRLKTSDRISFSRNDSEQRTEICSMNGSSERKGASVTDIYAAASAASAASLVTAADAAGGEAVGGGRDSDVLSVSERMTALFSSPLRQSTVLLWVVFFANAFTYYGLVLLTTQLAGGPVCIDGQSAATAIEPLSSDQSFLSILVASAGELPGLLLAAVLVDRIGRKRTVAGLLAGAGACSAALLLLLSPAAAPTAAATITATAASGTAGMVDAGLALATVTPASTAVVASVAAAAAEAGGSGGEAVAVADGGAAAAAITAALFLARACVMGSFQTLFAYAPEVYPTPVRSTGLGAANAFSRLGGVLCPFVAVGLLRQCQTTAALSLFAAVPTVAAAAALAFPVETSQRGLADEMDD